MKTKIKCLTSVFLTITMLLSIIVVADYGKRIGG